MSLFYRKNVGIVVFRRDLKVLMCARADKENAWQFPQGGIEDGEEVIAAGLRELREETGITSVRMMLQFPRLLRYKYPPEVVSSNKNSGFPAYIGQEQAWLLMYFYGKDDEINFEANPDEIEFKDYQWVDIDEAPLRIVDFKKDVYKEISSGFKNYMNALVVEKEPEDEMPIKEKKDIMAAIHKGINTNFPLSGLQKKYLKNLLLFSFMTVSANKDLSGSDLVKLVNGLFKKLIMDILKDEDGEEVENYDNALTIDLNQIIADGQQISFQKLQDKITPSSIISVIKTNTQGLSQRQLLNRLLSLRNEKDRKKDEIEEEKKKKQEKEDYDYELQQQREQMMDNLFREAYDSRGRD